MAQHAAPERGAGRGEAPGEVHAATLGRRGPGRRGRPQARGAGRDGGAAGAGQGRRRQAEDQAGEAAALELDPPPLAAPDVLDVLAEPAELALEEPASDEPEDAVAGVDALLLERLSVL